MQLSLWNGKNVVCQPYNLPHSLGNKGRLLAFGHCALSMQVYITRSLPPSIGICAPVVLKNNGPAKAQAISATSADVISHPQQVIRLIFFDADPIAGSPVLQQLLRPKGSIKDRIGMKHVYPNARFR